MSDQLSLVDVKRPIVGEERGERQATPSYDGERRAPADGGQQQQVDNGDGEKKDDSNVGEEMSDCEEEEGEEEECDGEEEESSVNDEESSDVGEEESTDAQNAAQAAATVANGMANGHYDYVYLRLISDIHPEECFLVKITEPMRNMKQLHNSQLNETQKQNLKQYFVYNGNLIKDEDTPLSLGVKETDDIHVFHTNGEALR